MHQPEAIIAADSISRENKRLTTFILRYWRPIHSELMTHRVFSRSAGSSRARPTKAIIKQVQQDPWGPLHWGKNQPGMQALEELDPHIKCVAQDQWDHAAMLAAYRAQCLMEMGIHKQVVNRILEPYTYIDVVVSSTSYNNWWALRDHADAQPEIKYLAQAMKKAYAASKPTVLEPGEWHLPLIMPEEFTSHGGHTDPTGLLRKISTARCARTSYKAFDGSIASLEKDQELYDKLLVSQPVHASPSEHQATPDTQSTYWVYKSDIHGAHKLIRAAPDWDNPHLHGNFSGWIQNRKLIPNEFVSG